MAKILCECGWFNNIGNDICKNPKCKRILIIKQVKDKDLIGKDLIDE